jgi:hypothetical protein
MCTIMAEEQKKDGKLVVVADWGSIRIISLHVQPHALLIQFDSILLLSLLCPSAVAYRWMVFTGTLREQFQ